MGQPYTHGIWHVKPGHADDFVAAWTELADWTLENIEGAGWGKLLRDRADPNRFISLGPWADDEAIARWRQDPGWQERIGRIREILDDFEAATLDALAERG